MQPLSVLCFGLLALAATSSYCSSGSSFPKDCDKRQKGCGVLLGGGKKHSGSSSHGSGSHGSHANSEEKSTPAVATTVAFTSATHGSCKCSCSHESSGDSSGNSHESSGDSHESSGNSHESSGTSHENSGSGHGHGLLPYDDYCLLLQYFYNISFEITDVVIYEAWLQFIYECQYEIIYDVSLTDEERLVAIWAKLEIFIEIHVEVKLIILYTYIVEWDGFVFDLEAVSLFVQFQYTETIVELDFTGSCILFEALLNGTAGNADLHAKVLILIQELKLILQVSYYSYNYKLVLIYEKFQAFFLQYSQYRLTILQIQIEGYGFFSSFFEVCANYWRVFHYEIAVGGSASSCGLIEALTACYQNASIGSSSQRAQIKQLVTDLTIYFEAHVDIKARIAYFISVFYEFIIIQEWSLEIVFSLEIEGYGNIYQLLLAYSFEFNCGPFNYGSQTTTAATTLAATTQAPVATTHASGDCSNINQLVIFAANTTDLVWSIDYEQSASWNSTQISRFAAYKQRIWTVCGNATATRQEVITNVVNVFNKWTTNTYYLELVWSIKVYIFHATSQQYYWGTIKQFCGCSP